MLLIRGRFEAATSGGPILLTGDFNSPPTGSDSGAYRIITGRVPPVQVDRRFTEAYTPGETQFPDFKFLDTRVETPRFGVSANFATFTGWSPSVTTEWARIDFVLGGSNRRWYVHFSNRCYIREFDFALTDNFSAWIRVLTVQGIYCMQGRCRDERRRNDAQRPPPCIRRLEHLVVTDNLLPGDWLRLGDCP